MLLICTIALRPSALREEQLKEAATSLRRQLETTQTDFHEKLAAAQTQVLADAEAVMHLTCAIFCGRRRSSHLIAQTAQASKDFFSEELHRVQADAARELQKVRHAFDRCRKA
eukprot:SAG31_NODE_26871_length_435_cov_0.741071_1_plen_112_part_10